MKKKQKVVIPPVDFDGGIKKFDDAYKKYISFLNGLDQNRLDSSITKKRYTLKNNNLGFWSLRVGAQNDKRFKTKSGCYFQNEAGDIKLKFSDIKRFNEKYGDGSKFLSLIETSYFIGITHINDVELVVAYAMLRANTEWETKLEEEIRQPFYGTEKLIWRDVKDAKIETSTPPVGFELSPLGKFLTDD